MWCDVMDDVMWCDVWLDVKGCHVRVMRCKWCDVMWWWFDVMWCACDANLRFLPVPQHSQTDVFPRILLIIFFACMYAVLLWSVSFFMFCCSSLQRCAVMWWVMWCDVMWRWCDGWCDVMWWVVAMWCGDVMWCNVMRDVMWCDVDWLVMWCAKATASSFLDKKMWILRI